MSSLDIHFMKSLPVLTRSILELTGKIIYSTFTAVKTDQDKAVTMNLHKKICCFPKMAK